MNTLDLTSAYLGGTQATGLYFGSTKLWPLTPPAPTGYRVTFATASISQATLQTRLANENITSFQTAQGSGSNETVFYTSTRYSINSNAFVAASSTPLLKYVDEGGCTAINAIAFADNYLLSHIEFPAVTSIGTSAFRNCKSLTSAIFPECTTVGASVFSMPFSGAPSPARLTTVDMPKVTSIGSSVFQACFLLTTINMPKLTTIGTNVFSMNALATGGTLNINSAITASANWNTADNLQRLQAALWTINYINNG
jgi:hypothetical protein